MKMKILLLTNILSPYRKVFYDKLYYGFQENGVEFTVLVMAENEPNRHWHYDEYKSDYSELLESKTIKISNVCFHFNKNIKKRIQEIRPDIIIASGHYLSPSVFKVIRMKHKLRYKLLFWSESHLDETRSYNSIKLKLRELMRNYIYKKFDGYWYAGEKSRQFIEKYAIKQKVKENRKTTKNKEYYFVPNLVDNNYYKSSMYVNKSEKEGVCQKYDIPYDHYIFVLSGRLELEKGILPFLKLFYYCNLKNKATIIIMGDGTLKNEIEQWILLYHLNVKLVGYLEQEEMRLLYSIGDCFLLPSISDANPLSCIEALWAGLPLLLSNHVGNYPETVYGGKNGYVFHYDYPQEVCNLIDKLISSDENWRSTARSISLTIAEETYEPNKVVKNLIENMLKDYNSD